jgi:NAD-reducing hydrogenase large subunit
LRDNLAHGVVTAQRVAITDDERPFAHGEAIAWLWHTVELLDDPDIVRADLMADRGPRRGEAVGVIEAPRGTLFHHYRVNENDLVAYCNLIVSTTSNNQAMNEAIRAVASRFLSGREVTEGLLNHIEIAIRAYDPCLSCATHALGQMRLEVDLVDAGGALVSRARKD